MKAIRDVCLTLAALIWAFLGAMLIGIILGGGVTCNGNHPVVEFLGTSVCQAAVR